MQGRKTIHGLVTLALLYGSSSGLLAGEEISSEPDDQTAVAVTIYNADLALIKDRRKVDLTGGENRLAIRGVSANIRPETAMLRSLGDDSPFTVVEQNFDYDLLTPAKLLDKYVGKEVTLVTTNPASGSEKSEKATVLSTSGGVVLRVGRRIETNPSGRFVFDTVPSNLRDQPTLVMTLDVHKSAGQEVELSYLSGGLSWKADYIAELSADDSKMDLLGLVTLNNTSGATYSNAKLQLVAGDVNRVKPRVQRMLKGEMMAMADVAMAPPMAEEGLLDYHLYTLSRPTTLKNQQTKQVALLNGNDVAVEKEYRLEGQEYFYRGRYSSSLQREKVGVFVSFSNKSSNGLGVPLPKGVVRVYKRDSRGNAQFVGEDSIDHTPKDETIKLKLGHAFDVTAERKQTAFSSQPTSGQYRTQTQSSFEILLKNRKDEAATVTVVERLPGEWKVLESSDPYKKLDVRRAQWRLELAPHTERLLKYTVRSRF
ncbi:MAG: DUF4139 domain-containing protein [bacterium]